MTLIGKVVAGIVAALYGLFMVALPDVTPERHSPVQTTVYTATSAHYSPAQTTNPATPATTPPLPAAGDCDAWVAVAYGIGWPAAALDTLELAMRLESGCNPQAVGDNGDSVGLMQLHCPTWATPNSNWPIGWTQHYGFGNCDALRHPITNLQAALAIWEGWAGSTPGWQHWHALP
jgi:hypothetical protein